MPCYAFARCGNGFRCSSRPPLGKTIYKSIRRSYGGVYQDERFDGPMSGRWFAFAMAVARARSTLERAKNQADPLKARDLIRSFERHYGIVVPPEATRLSRQQAIAAKQQLALGPHRGNVEYQLRTALGSDFRAWVTTPAGPGTAYPDNPWLNVGIFNAPARWKSIRIVPRVSLLGSRSVEWAHVSGDTDPVKVGDKLVVAPGLLGQQELITVLGRTSSTLTAVFTRPHEANAEAIMRPWPFWLSNQKHSLVVVARGRARDATLLNRVHRLLSQLLGATSTWSVVEENTTPGTAGPKSPGVDSAITPIQAVTF
jgi:hypothetical protein